MGGGQESFLQAALPPGRGDPRVSHGAGAMVEQGLEHADILEMREHFRGAQRGVLGHPEG